MERVRTALSLLAGKASADENQAFRTWLSAIAERVAKAAKEGGFLGFGGTQVSEEEQTFLDNLNSALQESTNVANPASA